MKKIIIWFTYVYLGTFHINALANDTSSLLTAVLPYEMCVRQNVDIEIYKYNPSTKEECLDPDNEAKIWNKVFKKCFTKFSDGIKDAGTRNVFEALRANNIDKFDGFKIGVFWYSRAFLFERLVRKCSSLEE